MYHIFSSAMFFERLENSGTFVNLRSTKDILVMRIGKRQLLRSGFWTPALVGSRSCGCRNGIALPKFDVGLYLWK